MLATINGNKPTNGFRMNENPKAIQKEAHTGQRRMSRIKGTLTRNLLTNENTFE